LLSAVAMTAFTATAYGPPWDAMQGTGTTATGIKLAPTVQSSMTGPYVVAVDPTIIPLGSKLKIWPNPFGYKGEFVAADTGGAIKGNHIDFYDPLGRASQDSWGVRTVNVSVVGKTSLLGPGFTSPVASSTPTGSSSTSGASSGPSEWVKVLIDGTLVAVGAVAIYRGGRRMLQTPRAGR
jgi:3D (Asp-Asp-Asp) domain-containing protein